MTRATHKIEGRRAAPPTGPARGKTFVVAHTPDTGTAFETHADEFAQKAQHDPDVWVFRGPLKGERIEFERQGSTELREWNGRRWRKIVDSAPINDLPANPTRPQIATAFNALLAELRKADVVDDPAGSSFAPGGE